MTEYDYSPEAYERYMAKQHAITRWVDETSHHAPANPFLPSEALGSPGPALVRGFDSDSDHGHSSSHYRHRDDRHRSHRRNSHHGSQDRSQNSRKHSRSSSSPPSPAYASPTSYPYAASPANQYPYPYSYRYGRPQYQQYAYPSASSTPNPPSSSQPYTPRYDRSPFSQPTLVPINGGAGGYVLVPPKGVSYQIVVCFVEFRHPIFLPPNSQYPQQPKSPSQTQPWYKRILSPTPSTSSSKNKLSKSNSSGSGRRKRSNRWSLDIY